MIPVTSFAGKTVAVFGLGGSGLASCHALKAGGAEVIAGDDNVDNVAKAAQAGFVTADLRSVSWANFAALILTPGAPLTHPAPHWSVRLARENARLSTFVTLSPVPRFAEWLKRELNAPPEIRWITALDAYPRCERRTKSFGEHFYYVSQEC